MVVKNNITAMNANRNLGITNAKVAVSAKKLSSGYKINNAADDAAGLSISEKMRKQIRGLTKASENCEDGISLCNVADGALNEVLEILQRENELAVKAANGTNSASDLQTINDELEQLSTEMDRIFETTKFNETLLFKGGMNNSGKIVNVGTPSITTTSTHTQETIDKTVWVNKGTTPSSNVPVETLKSSLDVDTKRFDPEYDSDKYGLSVRERVTTTSISEKIVTTDVYTKIVDTAYSRIQKPSMLASQNGFLNVSTEKGNLALSCAMTQLGIRVYDDSTDTTPARTSNSIYGEPRKWSTQYTIINDDQVENKYNLGNGITLTQTISRLGTEYNIYEINFKLSKADDNDGTISTSKVDLNLAFDVLNNPDMKSVNNGSKSFTIDGNEGKVTVFDAGNTASKCVFTTIDILQNNWDFDSIPDGADISLHTGAGFQFLNVAVSEGQTDVNVGSIQYRIDEIKKDPYELHRTIDRVIEKTETVVDRVETYSLLGGNFQVHAGDTQAMANKICMWLPDLSTKKLMVGFETDMNAFTAEASIKNVAGAIKAISAIRSRFGAMTNRMEHTVKNLDNVIENTSFSESQIRDTDMADEMVAFSNNQILLQAGQSMLAQANQKNNGVLALLGT